MSLQRQTGRIPAELAEAPVMPDGAEGLWSDFIELHSCRGSSGFGPSPITYRDILAWQEITASRLMPWEIDAIRRIDNAYFLSLADKKDAS